MNQLTLFKWHNTNFYFVRDEPDESSESPTFNLNNSEVQFRLSLQHNNEEEDGFCSLYLRLENLGDEASVDVQFRLWIESSDGEKFTDYQVEFTRSFDYEEQEEGDELFISRDSLFDEELAFEQNGSIVFCCQILHIKQANELSDFEFREKTYSLYESGVAGDCTLKVGNDEFKVPKNILMAGSDVFDRMFASITQESKTGIVNIEGVSAEIVKKFIKYLHFGNHMNELEKFAEELFVFADRYAVRNLMDICIKHIAKTFNSENIVHRLKIAFFSNNAELKNRALFYITDNTSEVTFQSILKSDQWMKLLIEDPTIANDILISSFDIIKSL